MKILSKLTKLVKSTHPSRIGFIMKTKRKKNSFPSEDSFCGCLYSHGITVWVLAWRCQSSSPQKPARKFIRNNILIDSIVCVNCWCMDSQLLIHVHYESWILVALHISLKLTILTCSTIRFSSYDVTNSQTSLLNHRCLKLYPSPLRPLRLNNCLISIVVCLKMKAKVTSSCSVSFQKSQSSWRSRFPRITTTR